MNPAWKIVVFFLFAIGAVAQQYSSHIPLLQKQNALQLEQQGKAAEAAAAWTAMSRAYPLEAEPYAHLGLIQSREGHYREAIPLYRKALTINANLPNLRMNLALALFKSEDLKAALPEFEECLKAAPPGSPEAQRLTILIGMSHYGLAQYAEAVPFLKDASHQEAQNLSLLLALAHSCLWSKQPQCAIDVYRQILLLDSESAEADMIAGEALNEMKDTVGATKMFRAAVAANPREPQVHFGLGYLLWTQKQYPEAVAEFQAELKSDPNHAQALVYLGDSYLQLTQSAAARSPLQKALALDPSLWIANRDLGILYFESGRKEDGLRELRKAVKMKPDEVSVHWQLARALRDMGRKEEAKIEFDKASKLNRAADDDLYKKIANGQRGQGNSEPAAPSVH